MLGPSPDVDVVLSICLQSNIPTAQADKSTTLPTPGTSDLSGSSKSHPISNAKSTRDRQTRKRKDIDSTSQSTLPFEFLYRILIYGVGLRISCKSMGLWRGCLFLLVGGITFWMVALS